jgi:hypothetical protein
MLLFEKLTVAQLVKKFPSFMKYKAHCCVRQSPSFFLILRLINSVHILPFNIILQNIFACVRYLWRNFVSGVHFSIQLHVITSILKHTHEKEARLLFSSASMIYRL